MDARVHSAVRPQPAYRGPGPGSRGHDRESHCRVAAPRHGDGWPPAGGAALAGPCRPAAQGRGALAPPYGGARAGLLTPLRPEAPGGLDSRAVQLASQVETRNVRPAYDVTTSRPVQGNLMKRLLLSVGLAVCPTLAVTQQPTTANLSLADALALARSHNPLYRQALHDRAPAGWAARNAWSSTFLPTLTASGGLGYSGSGQQRFLTANFSQNVSTLSSSYGLFLDWGLNGQTLTQIPLKHAQLSAADAGVAGAESNLVTGVTQQYLSVLQARDNADVARRELDRNEQFLKLAQARYDVGRSSLIDVRQAQVARGQAEVALLRSQTGLQLEKLRLFQQIGVTPPVDVASVQLTDTFAVQTPAWQLGDLLTMAEEQNPALKALRAREGAARWGVRAATGAYTPSVSVSASWSGFTQKLSDINPTIAAAQANAAANIAECQFESDYVNAVYEYHKAVAALEAAVGRPLR